MSDITSHCQKVSRPGAIGQQNSEVMGTALEASLASRHRASMTGGEWRMIRFSVCFCFVAFHWWTLCSVPSFQAQIVCILARSILMRQCKQFALFDCHTAPKKLTSRQQSRTKASEFVNISLESAVQSITVPDRQGKEFAIHYSTGPVRTALLSLPVPSSQYRIFLDQPATE